MQVSARRRQKILGTSILDPPSMKKEGMHNRSSSAAPDSRANMR